MRTHIARIDINKVGYISHEDYELMNSRLVEYSAITKEQAESTYKKFMKIADAFKFKCGVKIPLEEAAQQASKAALSMTLKQTRTLLYDQHNMLFDVLDT